MLIQNNYRVDRVENKIKQDSLINHKRTHFVIMLIFLAFIFILVKVFFFHANDKEYWVNQGENISHRIISMSAERGKVKDRNGIIIATDEPVGTVIVDPHKIPNFDEQRKKAKSQQDIERVNYAQKVYQVKVQSIAKILDIPYEKMALNLNYRTYLNKSKGDVYLKRNVDKTTIYQINKLNLKGIKIKSESKRRYPDGIFFGQIVGVSRVDLDVKTKKEKLVGLEGIEYAYNNKLQGIDGYKRFVQDNHGKFIEALGESKEVVNGRDLVLSIDKNIQVVTAEALKKAVEYHHADKGSAVVLDAKTGEILAMVSYPLFNPEEYKNYSVEQRKNHVIADLIEPGSGVKPFIVAKALENKIVTPNSVLNTSPYTIGNLTIKDVHNYGSLTVNGVIQKSSNVGVSKLALQMKAEDLYNFFKMLEFGNKTNAGFAGEERGIVRNWKRWVKMDQAVISYGYGLQMSLLQLARAYTIFTNEGELLPVTIVKLDTIPKGKKVISEKTANQLKEMLRSVVEKGGTGTRAQIEGYSAAGKSGTAQKLVRRGYAHNQHIGLFVGFAPVENPNIIVAVMIDNPKQNGYYGGAIAAPVFAEIASKSLNLRGVMSINK